MKRYVFLLPVVIFFSSIAEAQVYTQTDVLSTTPVVKVLTANTDVIPATASFIILQPATNITFTSSPIINDGSDGQVMVLINDATDYNVTFNSIINVATSGFYSSSNAVVMGASAAMTVQYSSARDNWTMLSLANAAINDGTGSGRYSHLANPMFQAFDNNGVPLVGGKLHVYVAGTSEATEVYTDVTGQTPHTNPIVLNARGEPTQGVIYGSGHYKYILKDPDGSTVWTADDIFLSNLDVTLSQFMLDFLSIGDATAAFRALNLGTMSLVDKDTGPVNGAGVAGRGIVLDATGKIDPDYLYSGGETPTTDATSTISDNLPRGYIDGLILGTTGAYTSLTVSVGEAKAYTNLEDISLTIAKEKTLVGWEFGDKGGLDTGTIAANTWYHTYVIEYPTKGFTDVMFSTSASAPSLTLRATGWTDSRRIGSFMTNNAGNGIRPFFQNGDKFYWETPYEEVDGPPVGGAWDVDNTNPYIRALTFVPTGISKRVFITYFITPGQAAEMRFDFFSPERANHKITYNINWTRITALDPYDLALNSWIWIGNNNNLAIGIPVGTAQDVDDLFVAAWEDL